MNRKFLFIAVIGIAAAAVALGWTFLSGDGVPDGLYRTNGRLEAEQVHVATKTAGRVAEVLVAEGDLVHRGDLLVRMDDQQLLARQREAQAQITAAELAWEEADAGVEQREAQLRLAQSELERAKSMFAKKVVPQETLDQAQSQFDSAKAALRLSKATADRGKASIEAAQASLAELETLLDDTQIKAPRDGRIQYVLARAGEVLSAGGRVVTILDITDVYMTVFLPATVAGNLSLHDEARLILDPAPEYVIPAQVKFVASDAQFTPKSVETSEQRDNLMFRAKLGIAPELLKAYEDRVKTGVRGVAWVRTDVNTAWPEELSKPLPSPGAADE